MKKDNFKVVLAGEGGQGVQSVALAFARAAFFAGLNISYVPNYGVEQRGGVSLGFLQFGKNPIGFPKFDKADIILVLCERAVLRVENFVSKETLYIYEADLIKSAKLASVHAEKLPIHATSVSGEKLDPKVFNMVLAGALLQETDLLSKEDLYKGLDYIFADKYKKKPQLKNLNKRAVELGERLAKEAYVK